MYNLGILITHLVVLYGLYFILFRDFDDFVESFQNIFKLYLGRGIPPTRAFIMFFLYVTFALSYHYYLG